MRKKFLGLLIGLLLSVPAFASVGVSPMRVEINANKLKTNYATATLNIKGDDTSPVRFRVYSEYFTINDKNTLTFLGKSNDQHSLTPKIKYVPSEFTVLPGKTQKLRINIPNLNSLPDGESRAILMIEDVNTKEYNIPTGMSGIGAQLIVKSRIAVPVYVDKGKVERSGEIEAIEVKKENGTLFTELKLKSIGNTRFRYITNIQIIQDKKLLHEYSLGENAFGSNRSYIQKDKLDLKEIKAPGEYTLRAVVTYTDPNGKKVNVKKETQFSI